MFLEIDGDEMVLFFVKVLFIDFGCFKFVSGKIMLILFLIYRV